MARPAKGVDTRKDNSTPFDDSGRATQTVRWGCSDGREVLGQIPVIDAAQAFVGDWLVSSVNPTSFNSSRALLRRTTPGRSW